MNPAGSAEGLRARALTLDGRARGHSGWWAFVLHRISGVALTIFLPAHFMVLGRALNGEASLDTFLRWTHDPLVRASEIVLVFLLAVHLAGGVRLLLIELRGWRASWQPGLIATTIGAALVCALAFALNLTGHP